MTTSGTAAPVDQSDQPPRSGDTPEPVRLLSRTNLPVVVGIVALVTLAASRTAR